LVNVEFLGNTALAKLIAQQLGKKLTSYQIKRFSDGESYAYIEHGDQLKGKQVLLFAQFEYGNAKFVNDQFMSLLLTVDQLKKIGVTTITAVLPYLPFSRQDKDASGTGVGGVSLIGKLCNVVGIDEIICCDLHTESIKKHFAIPIHSIDVTNLWLEQLKQYTNSDICLIAPDLGSKERVYKLAQLAGCAYAYVEKYRQKPNSSIVRNLVGSVEGKTAIIIDDILDTAGTAINACNVLKEHDAESVHGFFTHGILSGQAVEKLASSPFEKIILTDTIEHENLNNHELFLITSSSELLSNGINTYFSKNYVTST